MTIIEDVEQTLRDRERIKEHEAEIKALKDRIKLADTLADAVNNVSQPTSIMRALAAYREGNSDE